MILLLTVGFEMSLKGTRYHAACLASTHFYSAWIFPVKSIALYPACIHGVDEFIYHEYIMDPNSSTVAKQCSPAQDMLAHGRSGHAQSRPVYFGARSVR